MVCLANRKFRVTNAWQSFFKTLVWRTKQKSHHLRHYNHDHNLQVWKGNKDKRWQKYFLYSTASPSFILHLKAEAWEQNSLSIDKNRKKLTKTNPVPIDKNRTFKTAVTGWKHCHLHSFHSISQEHRLWIYLILKHDGYFRIKKIF